MCIASKHMEKVFSVLKNDMNVLLLVQTLTLMTGFVVQGHKYINLCIIL